MEEGNVFDTWLLHRLYTLATEGRTAGRKGEGTLEHCARHYLGYDLPKDVKDSSGNDVRTSYGRYVGRDPREIEPVYLEYLAKDALATVLVFDELVDHVLTVLEESAGTWGYVSDDWMREQVGRWGPQTHHIQLKAAIVLDAITANGIGLDVDGRDDLAAEIAALVTEKQAALAAHGYQPGEGSSKRLQEVIGQTLRRHPELKLPRTKTGKYETSEEALADLACANPFFQELLDYKAASKLQQTYLEKMGRPRLHPRFDVLKNTGRTSSFGDINAQNLPRDDRVRRCFVPTEGYVYLDADYSTIEMATLAQSVLRQFGGRSAMAEAINAGKDLHRLVAAEVTGKPEDEVTKDERAKAKPINFGKPGGMGTATLKGYAKASYGIALTDQEVTALEQAWFDLFPEMESFLADQADVGQELAELLDLTPAGYRKACGNKGFWATSPDDKRPAGWLGWMCLKVLRDKEPATREDRPYSQDEVDYFWEQAQALDQLLTRPLCDVLADRRPSPELAQAVRNQLGRAAVFTLTGRLRANATYCARHNTVFQGLAADGAKLALWRLWRSGYKLVNFVHDQVLIEVPEDAGLPSVAADVEGIMVEGMREVVPDVLVKVEWAYRHRWSKRPEDQVELEHSERECASRP